MITSTPAAWHAEYPGTPEDTGTVIFPEHVTAGPGLVTAPARTAATRRRAGHCLPLEQLPGFLRRYPDAKRLAH